MEHQTEDSGTVSPDQVPEAYAAEPPSGAAGDMVGESAGSRADTEDDLAPDADGEPLTDAEDEMASVVAGRQATGEPRVDAALARLDDLAGMPVTEHRAVFEDVHRRLRDVLGELDTGQPPDAEGAESRRAR
jgi:hypothetical protein